MTVVRAGPGGGYGRVAVRKEGRSPRVGAGYDM